MYFIVSIEIQFSSILAFSFTFNILLFKPSTSVYKPFYQF